MNILQREIVLELDKTYRAIGICSVGEAFVRICGTSSKRPLDMEVSDDGVVLRAVPMTFEQWIALPVRPGDHAVRTAHQLVRVPRVIVAPDFVGITRPRRLPLTTGGLYIRDGGVCQYTGQPVPRDQATKDHVIPRSRGGPSTWTNLVLTSSTVNRLKGNRTPEEAGLKLLRKPQVPPPKVVPFRPPGDPLPEWQPFLG